MEALQREDSDGLARTLAADYVDGLGARKEALADAHRWWAAPADFDIRHLTCRRLPSNRTFESPRWTEVAVELDADIPGPVPWRVEGPFRSAVVRGLDARIRSGWLVELRSAQRVASALSQARAPGDVRDLLHPDFRQGWTDRAEAARAWGSRRLAVTHGRLELRERGAHLDLFHRGFEDPRLGRVLRLTLKPAAGRLRIAAGLPGLD